MAQALICSCGLRKRLDAFCKDILAVLAGLPEENIHCAALAVDTLNAAIVDYRAKKSALNLYPSDFYDIKRCLT